MGMAHLVHYHHLSKGTTTTTITTNLLLHPNPNPKRNIKGNRNRIGNGIRNGPSPIGICSSLPTIRASLTSLQIPSLPSKLLANSWQGVLAHFADGRLQGYMVSLAPVVVASGVSWKLGVGLERDMQIAVLRSFVQLISLGFILNTIFEGRNLLLSGLGITAMVLLAGYTAGEQAKLLPKSHIIAIASLALGTLGSVALMILLNVYSIEPNIVIPVTGHILGNSMIMVGATLKTLQFEISRHKGQIEAALALGATPKKAVEGYVQRASMLGMSPMIDAIKVMGLVSLPGNMTGLLMGGALPREAIKQQIRIMNVVLGAAAISCVISTILGWHMMFTKTCQLQES